MEPGRHHRHPGHGVDGAAHAAGHGARGGAGAGRAARAGGCLRGAVLSGGHAVQPDRWHAGAEIVIDKSFTVESKLPLCVMRFEHELSATSTGTKAIHRITFSGLFSPIFSRLIGGSIRKGLPQTMAGLKQAAEQANNSFKPT